MPDNARPWVAVVELDSETAIFGPFSSQNEADEWISNLDREEYLIEESYSGRLWDPSDSREAKLTWRWTVQ